MSPWLEHTRWPEIRDALWQFEHAESPLTLLRACADLREHFAIIVDAAVLEARETGSSWEAIAESMRVSRQAVHRRYADRAAEPPDPEAHES